MAAALGRGFRDALRVPGEPASAAHARQVHLVHMDNLYDGWAGLEVGMGTLASAVVAPLRRGEPGRYRRYDWHRGVFAEERVVAPCDVLVVEGVGSGGSAHHDAVTCLVWVETPADIRLERGLARDGADQHRHWSGWQRQEAAMFARERTRQRADVVVDGSSGRLATHLG